MKNKKVVLAVIGCLSILCLVTGILVVVAVKMANEDKNEDTHTQEDRDNEDGSTSTPKGNSDNPKSFNSFDFESDVESIRNDDIDIPDVEFVTFPQFDIGVDILMSLEAKGWAGTTASANITYEELDQADLQNYIAIRKELDDVRVIPERYEKYYTSTDSSDQILQIMQEARQEYLSYIEAKGGHKDYIDEINDRILPADNDRLRYHKGVEGNAPASASYPYSEADEATRYISISPADIHKMARIFGESGILGSDALEDNYLTLRNMGIRFIMYHEMTHVLQKAYENLHVEESKRKESGSYIWASKRLEMIDDTNFWNWSEYDGTDLVDNRRVGSESQADGIAFEMMTNVYDASDAQKLAIWQHLFGRLDLTKKDLETIKEISANYPKFNPTDLSVIGLDTFRNYPDKDGKAVLDRLVRQLSGLPEYYGYLHPLKPDQTELFWDALTIQPQP